MAEEDISTFGKKPRAAVSPDMNVTPLVDVVLVLLIIFMVLAPVMSAHHNAKLPPPDDPKDQELQEQNDPLEPLVVRVEVDGTLSVGGVPLEPDPMVAAERITRLLNPRPNLLLYLDASDEAPYGDVLSGLEVVKDAGAKPVVLVTKEIPPDK